jgi:diguanylate cyclase (GGDEF)-like protein
MRNYLTILNFAHCSTVFLARFLLIFCCANALSWAQPDQSSAGKARTASYRAQSFNAAQGAINNVLLGVTVLQDGRIAIISDRGPPMVFDGHRFQEFEHDADAPFPAQGGYIIVQRRDGVVFAISREKTLLRYANKRWSTVALPDNAPGYRVSLSNNGNELLIATDIGLYLLRSDNHAITKLSSISNITAVAQAHDGTLWIGAKSGLFRIAAGDTTSEAMFASEIVNVHIWCLTIDPKGRVLIGTRGLGLGIVDDDELVFVRQADGLPHDVVRAIVCLDGAIWVATAGGGIAKIDGDDISVFNSTDGLASDSVTWLAPDSAGVLWATTAGAGLSRLWPSGFSHVVDKFGRRGGFHYALHRDPKGQLWSGSNIGLSRINGLVSTRIGVPGAAQASTVLSIADVPDGRLLLGTRRGLFTYKAAEGFRSVNGGDNLTNVEVYRRRDGSIVVGSEQSLWRYTGTNLVLLAQFPGAVIRSLFDDAQLGLLIATNRGAFSYSGNNVVQAMGKVARRGNFYRDGDMLLVTGENLSVWRDNDWRPIDLLIGRRSSGQVFSIYRAGTRVWLTAQEGLLSVPQLTLQSAATGAVDKAKSSYTVGSSTVPPLALQVDRFSLQDGLASTEFEGSAQAFLTTENAGIYFVSTGGVSLLEPTVLQRALPETRVSVVDLANENTSFSAISGTVFPPGTRRVALSLAALPAAMSTNMRVRYRLSPIETTFRDDAGLREAVYGGLGPGDYQLELESDLGLQRSANTFAFQIAPLLLERWSVRIALALFVLALVVLLPLMHIRSLRLQRETLLASVAEKTESLQRQAVTDGLTSLKNRRAFDQALAANLSRANDIGLIMLDVDYFKRYNDHLGHPAGDTCLIAIAQVLQKVADENDAFAARIGGEEFAMLLCGTGAAHVVELSHAIHAAVTALALPHPAAPSGSVSVSVGAAMAKNTDATELMRRADAALYAAKEAGRDRVIIAADAA